MRQIKKYGAVLGFMFLLSFLQIVNAGMLSAQGRKVVLTADDGYRITGVLSEAAGAQQGVVLLHMYRNGKESWQPLIGELVARSITCLAIDMRGHGESRFDPAGTDDWPRVMARDPMLFNAMHRDGEAGVRYLQSAAGIPAGRIGLVGASVGCSVAIHTAVLRAVPVKAVVVLTPGANYLGVPTLEHIKKWPGQTPLLILSSREEKDRGAVQIHAQLQDRGATLRLFAEESIHGTNMFGRVEGVEGLIAGWLGERL